MKEKVEKYQRIEVAFLTRSKENIPKTLDGYSLSIESSFKGIADFSLRDFMTININEFTSGDIVTYARVRGYSVDINFRDGIVFYLGGGTKPNNK